MRVTRSRLPPVLILIGWEDGVNFLGQSTREAKQKRRKLFRIKIDTRSKFFLKNTRKNSWSPTANKTRVLEHLLFVLLLAPQISKRINNDAKYQVKNNNDDHKEEEQIVYNTSHEHVLFHGGPSEDVSNSPSISEPLVQSSDDAHY